MDQQQQKKYVYWEWRTIIALMIAYALYYFVRKNFSVAVPAMEAELGISKAKLGAFMTANGIIYGVSRFINGILADRFSKKKLMAAGLALSAIVNLVICFSPALGKIFNMLDGEGKATLGLVYLIGSLWVLNGYLQGMGVPPCLSILAHWVKPSELATKQSIWNTSHSFGAGLVVFLCGFLLQKFGYSAWYLCFAVPAILSLLGLPVILFGLKDSPASVGLPPVEKMEKKNDVTGTDSVTEQLNLKGDAFKKYLNKMVFANPYIWIISIFNFCVYVIRFTILDWGATFLTQYKGMEISAAAGIVGSSELFGGVLGMIVAGWISDKVFKSKAHRTCLVFDLLATFTFFLFWKSGNLTVSVILLLVSSFFIYGPQALTGACISQQATKHATGTANGIAGIFGYASTAISGILFGFLADSVWGWDSVFLVSIAFGIVGAILIATMWNAPATGYARSERVIAEINAKSQD